MDFTHSAHSRVFQERVSEFMHSHVFPSERIYAEQLLRQSDAHHREPPVMKDLRAEARRRGLWNLFFPNEEYGANLTNAEYAPVAEIMGHSLIAPYTMNCHAPDTGNMEILAEFGTPEQKAKWLGPLLEGEMGSCLGMTEPAVASSDPTNLRGSIARDGSDLVINGDKWWTTGAASIECRLCLFLGVTDATAERHSRHSIVLVPMDAPGVKIERTLPVFGYDEGHGHCHISFTDVRVPQSSILGAMGAGLQIAQARLGPGRIHHCMRAIGMAERALELMCKRAQSRIAFGTPLSKQGVIRDWIAEARIRIEQARLLTLKAAWIMDTEGKVAARSHISAIKVAAADLATWVIDRAIQVHGGAGFSADFPLAAMYAHARTLHIVDGADEVHKMVLARHELERHRLPSPRGT